MSKYHNDSGWSCRLCDFWFILFALAYSLLALNGVADISAGGTILDSDLQTYAQGMAGERDPEAFAADPVLRNSSQANSIPNLQRMLADVLGPEDNPGLGLLRAGAVAIFIFFCGWYLFGRWLYGPPALAAALAFLAGITVWVGWGTFWGISHSDPVPRVFFAAALPWLLAVAITAVTAPLLRPVAMFLAGLCMWIHGISALNYGAMIFMAFLLLKPRNLSLGGHAAGCVISLAAFFAPVLTFLWPSLQQSQNFSNADLAIFMEMFQMRWAEDYSNFWARLRLFFTPFEPTFILTAGGTVCWFIDRHFSSGRQKTFCRMCPPFILALALVTVFCWAETRYAPEMGRLPMGHELARGWRFVVPIAWILFVSAIGCMRSKGLNRLVCAVAIGCVLLCSSDRQYMAAQHALCSLTGIQLPLCGVAEKEEAVAAEYRQMLEEIARQVPHGEAIFSNGEAMALRYMIRRPLVHTFKDGYVFFYNKDLQGVKNWLEYEKLLSDQGVAAAWEKSGAPWLLIRNERNNTRELAGIGRMVWENGDWMLLRRK